MPLPKEILFTYEDILTWEGPERCELIDGVPQLLASPSRVHQEVSGELFRQIATHLHGKPCKVYAAPFDVRLFEEDGNTPEDVDTVVVPDISVICDKSKLDDRGCKGAPDFVIEILSPSTQRTDRLVKLNLYQKAGVREYWLADPSNKTIQVCLLENGVYRVAQIYTETDSAEIQTLGGIPVDLSMVFHQ